MRRRSSSEIHTEGDEQQALTSSVALLPQNTIEIRPDKDKKTSCQWTVGTMMHLLKIIFLPSAIVTAWLLLNFLVKKRDVILGDICCGENTEGFVGAEKNRINLTGAPCAQGVTVYTCSTFPCSQIPGNPQGATQWATDMHFLTPNATDLLRLCAQVMQSCGIFGHSSEFAKNPSSGGAVACGAMNASEKIAIILVISVTIAYLISCGRWGVNAYRQRNNPNASSPNRSAADESGIQYTPQ